MEPMLDFAQLQLHFVDQIQWRYEVIRPLVLFADRSATARAQETDTHPETVGKLKRRFEQQGMLGLMPDTLEVVTPGRRRRVPETVVEEIARLKGLRGFSIVNWPGSSLTSGASASMTKRSKLSGTRARRRRPSNCRSWTITATRIARMPGSRSFNSMPKAGASAVSAATYMSPVRPSPPGSVALRPKSWRVSRTKAGRRMRRPGRPGCP